MVLMHVHGVVEVMGTAPSATGLQQLEEAHRRRGRRPLLPAAGDGHHAQLTAGEAAGRVTALVATASGAR
jgi:hypothetical protein